LAWNPDPWAFFNSLLRPPAEFAPPPATPVPPDLPHPPRLSTAARASYGAADFGLSATELLLQLYLLEFYLTAVGLNPVLGGLALAIAVLWDAVSDPLMGIVCDRTRSRWGRFTPWLVVGAGVMASGLVLVFHPPVAANQMLLFGWLLVSYSLLNTGMTMLAVPHLGLAAALGNNPEERSALFGWRLVFGTGGLFAGILTPLVVAALRSADVTTPYGLLASRGGAAWVLAVLVVGFTAWTVTGTRQSRYLRLAPNSGWRPRLIAAEIGSLFRLQPFRVLFGCFLLIAAARTLNASFALPYYKIRLQLPEAVVQQQVLGLFTVAIIGAVPLWLAIARRFGKPLPAAGALIGLGLLTVIGYPLFPPGQLAGPLLAAIVGGVAVAAIILFESMLADLAECDAQSSAHNREGLFFGFWKLGQKLVRSLGLLVAGLLLGWAGVTGDSADGAAATRLAWLFGPVTGSLFLLAAARFLIAIRGSNFLQRLG
jgi:glycoside/pentoside/hexuronide:cation symporter, GPH family